MSSIDPALISSWQKQQLIKALNQLWPTLNAEDLDSLQGHFEWLHLSNNDILFHQNDVADSMYLVINGRLRAATVEGDKHKIIGEIGRGETVGELALLSDNIRSATVYAARETNVVKITATAFEALIQVRPHLLLQITKLLVDRQKRSLQPTKPQPSPSLTLALIPASPEIDIRQFAQDLHQSLANHDTTLTLDPKSFEARYGQAGVSQTPASDPLHPTLVAWMDQLENDYRYCLYVTDYDETAWTKRCIGHADRVLVIANPQNDPKPSPTEESLNQLQFPLRTELVLWHPPETERPQNTLPWLQARQVHTHYHVRRGDQSHLARMARRLTGNAIALVLSGGGARGFAHMGVHQALEELNIPLDYVGGASMGAVLGASFYVAENNAELLKLATLFADPKTLLDYTLPFTALTSSKKVTKITQALYGDLQIEDMWYPFFCVASNLSTAEPVVFERGLLWKAVRASLALPGVFTPVIENGEVLVDGGVMDNFPLKLMAQRCESEHIIGVNINPYQYKRSKFDLETSIGGWGILLNRLNPFSKRLRVPSLIGTMMQSVIINSVRQSKDDESLADIIIHPNTKKFSIMDYGNFADISKVGYEAAIESLPTWYKERSKR